MNTLTSNQKVLISALVGFIIGAAAIWVWTISTGASRGKTAEDTAKEMTASVEEATEGAADTSTSGETATVASKETSPAPSAAGSMSNSELISVSAQPAGTQVQVRVSLSSAGWVAVHEEREGGLGNVLGAKWLPEGDHDVTVNLLRATASGQTYHVVLYNDDGDRQFEYKKGDAHMLDGSKQPIQASFKAN